MWLARTRHQNNSSLFSSTLPGGFPSAPSLTSSPAANKPDGSSSPHHMVADQSTIQSSSETLNDFYGLNVGTAGRRGLLRSTGSSSSTSLEVSEIFEGSRRGVSGVHDVSVCAGTHFHQHHQEAGPAGDHLQLVTAAGAEVRKQEPLHHQRCHFPLARVIFSYGFALLVVRLCTNLFFNSTCFMFYIELEMWVHL